MIEVYDAYVEAGYLFGTKATHVEIKGADGTLDLYDPRIGGSEVVVVVLSSVKGSGAEELRRAEAVVRLLTRRQCSCVVILPPGLDTRQCTPTFLSRSIVKIDSDAVFDLTSESIPSGVGCVSLHGWHGAGVARLVQTAPVRMSRCMVLSPSDLGQAKAWIEEEPSRASWQLFIDHPMNDLEPAQLESRFAR